MAVSEMNLMRGILIVNENKNKLKMELLRSNITGKWVVSAVLAGLSVFFTGAYVVLSPDVFVDFKQLDILFILFFFIIVFFVGFVLIFYAKSWKAGIALLMIPFISAAGLILYYEKILIHSLNTIEGPKLVVLYPDKFKNIKLKNEWDRSINEIPDLIENNDTQIKLLKIPTRFTENIDDSLLLREINSHYDVVGYIIMHEAENAVKLELKLPAIEDMQRVGVSWSESEYGESGIEKQLKIKAGYGKLSYNYFLKIQKTGPHIGTYSGASGAGFNISPKELSLDDIRKFKKLPVADVLDVPINNLTRGVVFSANMISIAYLSLAGYTENYCSNLEKYIEFDSLSQEFDFLKKLDPIIVESCFSDKDASLIERITESISEKEKEAIYVRAIKKILSSSDVDNQYIKNRIFKKELVDKAIKIRESCKLEIAGYGYYRAIDCTLGFMEGGNEIKIDEPLLKIALSKKIYELLNAAFFSSLGDMDYRGIQTNMVEYDRASSLIGGGENNCNIKYLFLLYSLLRISNFDEINKSEKNILNYINAVSDVFSETSKTTQCKRIEIYGVDFSDFVFNEENRKLFAVEYKKLLELPGTDVRVKDFLSQFLKLMYPYLGNKNELSGYVKTGNKHNANKDAANKDAAYNDAELVVEYLKNRYFEYFNHRKIDDDVANSFLSDVSMILESRSITYDSVLNYRLDEKGLKKIDDFFSRSGLVEIAKLYLINFYKKNEKIKDPLISEGIRYMYDIYTNKKINNPASLKPLVFKNPVHMISLYFYLKKSTHNKEQLNEAMNVMSEIYPDEVDGLIYKHFEMLKDHLGGDYNRAKDRANDIVPYVDQQMKSFYRFYIDSIQYNSDNIKCSGKSGSKFSWSEYVVNKHRPVIINHMLMDKFDLSVWEKQEESSERKSIAEMDILAYDKRFKNKLSRYIERYYDNNEKGGSRKGDEIPDSLLLDAIADSRQQCGL